MMNDELKSSGLSFIVHHSSFIVSSFRMSRPENLFEKSRRDGITVARHVSAGSGQERTNRVPSGTASRYVVPDGTLQMLLLSIPSTDVLGYCSIVPTGLFKQLLIARQRERRKAKGQFTADVIKAVFASLLPFP